jgi:hypothetical protein
MKSLGKALLRYCGELQENRVLEEALYSMSWIMLRNSVAIECMKM